MNQTAQALLLISTPLFCVENARLRFKAIFSQSAGLYDFFIAICSNRPFLWLNSGQRKGAMVSILLFLNNSKMKAKQRAMRNKKLYMWYYLSQIEHVFSCRHIGFQRCTSVVVQILYKQKFIWNERKRFFLYISARHTWDHKGTLFKCLIGDTANWKSSQVIKTEVNDFREDIPLAAKISANSRLKSGHVTFSFLLL